MSLQELREEARALIEGADEVQLWNAMEALREETGELDEWEKAELADVEAIREKHLREGGKTYSAEEVLASMRAIIEQYRRVQA